MGLFLSENLIKCCKGVENSLIKLMCLECAPKWACVVVREGEVTIEDRLVSYSIDFQILPGSFIWIQIWLPQDFAEKVSSEDVSSPFRIWPLLEGAFLSCVHCFHQLAEQPKAAAGFLLPSKQHVVSPCASCFVEWVHGNIYALSAVNSQE